MDSTPFDIEALSRLANDLFKADAVPATSDIGPAGLPPSPQAVRPETLVPPETPSLVAPGGAPVPPGGASPVRPGLGAPLAPQSFLSAAPPPAAHAGYQEPFSFHPGDILRIGDSFPEEAELRALLARHDLPFLDGGAVPSVSRDVRQAPGASTASPRSFAAPTGEPVTPATPGLPGSPTGLTPSATPSFYFVDEGYFADDVPKAAKSAETIFTPDGVRRDFPIFKQRVNGYPLIWLDNGATTQKPQAVIDRIAAFYENENSNIHRGAHELAARATDAYEDARKTVQRFINAGSVDELIFVRGTTEGINLVAQSFGRRFIGKGDEIVVTHFEHHANIVPWYLLAKETGAVLRVAPVDDKGDIILDEYERLLNGRTKIVAMTHVSNALGSVLPAKTMIAIAHRHGIPVLLDGAQSISHMPVDVQDLDCDFFVFSGHKVFAPTGIGVVYGKTSYLDSMPPWQGGGNMIKDVTFEKIEFQPAPSRFEAGTGNIADAVGLGEALKYLERFGMANIMRYEHDLLDYALHRLREIRGLQIIGDPTERAGVISLLVEGLPPVEVGKALNQKGIAVRAGHHCAMPILRRFGVEATVRPSFALYNTFDDVDHLAETLRDIAINRAN